MFVARLRNLVALAYLVPPERVRGLVPLRYQLEPAGEQRRQALIATLWFENDPLRPSLLPFPRLRYHQVNFRIYILHRGLRGVYFVRSYLSNWQAWPLVAASPKASFARFQSRITESRVYLRAEAGGAVSEIEARPSAQRALRFPGLGDRAQAVVTVTHVLSGFLRARLGVELELPVSHRLMDPTDLDVARVRLDDWTSRDVLRPRELGAPAAAFFQPEIDFHFAAPRPV